MNKLLLVARREYFYNLRRRSFLFAVFGVPLFTFGIWAIIFFFTAQNESNAARIGTVGYVDNAEVLTNPQFPETLTVKFEPYADVEQARQALDAKTIGAYFVLPADYLKTGVVESYSYDGIPSALQNEIEALLVANLGQRLDADVPLDRVQNPVNLTVRAEDSGRTMTEAALPALFFIPMIFAFIFMMASNVTSGFLMGGIVEEKTNRIMEILMTSVTPMQLLMGKIIGLGALGLTQLAVWGTAGFLLVHFGQSVPVLSGVSIPGDLVLTFIVYFLLSYFFLASLLAGLGSTVGSEEESRQFSSIISLLFVIPFFFIGVLINDPNGSLALALTLIPFTAPMTALLRLGFTAVPAWQILLSLGILFVTTVVVAWASARVFRVALLMTGKRPSPREIWRLIRQPSVTQERAA